MQRLTCHFLRCCALRASLFCCRGHGGGQDHRIFLRQIEREFNMRRQRFVLDMQRLTCAQFRQIHFNKFCLPAHLPEFIEVDLSELSAGQSLHIKDVSLPSHVELALYLSQENPVILSATVPSATEEAGAESATSEGNDTSAAA